MYRLKVYDYFSSAHFLEGYQGKCESLHGHNWKVEAEVKGKELDNLGMLIDFKILKEYLTKVLKEMDHRLLNDIEEFKKTNPSAEFIARYVFKRLKRLLPKGVNVSAVSVWETERSQAIYSEK